MTIHMNQPEKIQTHRRRQPTQHHPRENQTILIRLMMRRQVIQIQHPNLQHRRVRAVAQIRHDKRREQLDREILVMDPHDVDDNREQRQNRLLIKKSYFAPNDCDRKRPEDDSQELPYVAQ